MFFFNLWFIFETPMDVLFVTNFCTHFLVKPFEEVAQLGHVRFIFYSDGGESYWETRNQLHGGKFEHRYLPGFYLGRNVRVTPSLIAEILTTRAHAIVLSLTGRFAIPVTYFLARIRRKPFILWTGMWYHPQSFFHRLSWPLTLWIYRHSDALLAYGEHVKRYLVEHGVPAEKVFLFWQSVDVEKMGRKTDPAKVAAYRSRWSPDGSPIILFVGRLDPVKSSPTLIAAYAKLKAKTPCRLVIVGKGPEKENLVRLASASGADIIFEDFIPNPELPEVYAAADVFCLPSESLPTVKEAWGLVLNEAMLQGCVPVASDAVGAAVGGLFFGELESLVFPERDADALANKLGSAIEYSARPDLREKIREKARFFSPANQARGLAEAYRYVTRERN
jgi:glycosyltransferase involved in cell wall biosynthesis